ncbi:peptidase inhibitor family I36 protein [Nonomuraea sp. NPDC050394]|uniref:peptidase inhibitor family I36 protein n=1 Tax=Nonomuraea sp. NPDC050394 TaxID=3364363 RepID=UPI00378BFB26
MKRKIALAAGALSLGIMGFGTFASPAQATPEATVEVIDNVSAAADRFPCDNNRVCLYEHDGFTGRPYIQITLAADGCGNLPSAYNNWASSIKNTYDRSVWLYDRANCSGSPGYTARAESQDKDLTNNGFDNKTSSLYRL